MFKIVRLSIFCLFEKLWSQLQWQLSFTITLWVSEFSVHYKVNLYNNIIMIYLREWLLWATAPIEILLGSKSISDISLTGEDRRIEDIPVGVISQCWGLLASYNSDAVCQIIPSLKNQRNDKFDSLLFSRRVTWHTLVLEGKLSTKPSLLTAIYIYLLLLVAGAADRALHRRGKMFRAVLQPL